MKKLVIVNIVILFLIFLFIIIFEPHLLTSKQGVTLTTTQASFYIPSFNPIKVYKFDPNPKELHQIIAKYTNNSEAKFGIFIKNLNTGQEVSLNPDESFTAASLYKLAVMYTMFEKASKGEIELQKPDIAENIKTMITVSSNESSLYLVEKYTGWQEITSKMHYIGLKYTSLNQIPPVTTPSDMAHLLELIADGKAVSFDASLSMLELLAAQQRNDRIPVFLPPETVVAHKTGELFDVRHDAGVVIGPDNNYVLVIMSKDSLDPEAVKPVMAQLSLEIYEFFKTQWANPPEIL